jgi:ATP-dependent helicase/nuclease subunit A
MEIDRDEVRVMTVHGAKGLEAPIVILADTTTPPQGWHPPRLLRLPPHKPVPGAAERLIWAAGKSYDVGPMADAREAVLNEARDEYRRLLYVAMTRAAERLIVCGTQAGTRKIPDGCWYQLVSDALALDCVNEPADDGAGAVLRYRKGAPEPEQPVTQVEKPAPDIVLPPWLTRAATPDIPKWRTIAPSHVMEGETRPVAGGGGANALLRGSLVHRLLQSLPDIPAARRRKAAEDFLSRAGGKLPAEERGKLAEQVMRILDDLRFSELFGPASRAEVPIVGKLTLGGQAWRVSGQVDRLIVTQAAVLIADFKTNRPAPRRIEEVPPAYLRQLALYRAVLAKLYPDTPLRAALIWTEVPDLMELSTEVLDGALAQVTPA